MKHRLPSKNSTHATPSATYSKETHDSPTSPRYTFFRKKVSTEKHHPLNFSQQHRRPPAYAARRNQSSSLITLIESAHFHPSRFPTGCPTYLPANAPATATTHSNPTTSPGGADSSGSTPEDSALVRTCWSATSASESAAGEAPTKRSPLSTNREDPGTSPAPSACASNM